jgi:hypothetical protein
MSRSLRQPCLAVHAAVLVAFAELAACSGETKQAGGLELVLATDMSVPSSIDSLHVEISEQAGQGTWNLLFKNDLPLRTPASLPTTISIAAGTSPNEVARVEVTATKDTKPLVYREIEVEVPVARVARLDVLISSACLGQLKIVGGVAMTVCPDSAQSCQPDTGRCGYSMVDPKTLPDYMPGDLGGLDATVEAATDSKDAGSDRTTDDVGPAGHTPEAGPEGAADGEPGASEAGHGAGDASEALEAGRDSGALHVDAGTDASTADGGDAGCQMNLSCTLPAPPSTGDVHQDCVNRVNQFRTVCACIAPLQRWTAGEACADMMAQYDAMMNMAQAGVVANLCSWGNAQDECPGYTTNAQVIGTCLQQMWSEGPPPAGTTVGACEGSVPGCFAMHGHFINMSDPSMTKIACGFSTTDAGAVWSVQDLSH